MIAVQFENVKSFFDQLMHQVQTMKTEKNWTKVLQR